MPSKNKTVEECKKLFYLLGLTSNPKLIYFRYFSILAHVRVTFSVKTLINDTTCCLVYYLSELKVYLKTNKLFYARKFFQNYSV